MTLKESIEAVYTELMSMTPEEFYEELNKPIENGIGDLLLDAGVDLRKMIGMRPCDKCQNI